MPTPNRTTREATSTVTNDHNSTATHGSPPQTPSSRGTGQLTVKRRGAVASALSARWFEFLSTGMGLFILIILAAVAAFLVSEAMPALTADTEELQKISWFYADSVIGYVGPLIFGTLLASLIALLLAVPLAVGIALFISHYAPRKLSGPLGYVIDLLAAIPSVVYGLWGRYGSRQLSTRPSAGSRQRSDLSPCSLIISPREEHSDRIDCPRRDDPAHHHCSSTRSVPPNPPPS